MKILALLLTLSLFGCEEPSPRSPHKKHPATTQKTIKPSDITSDAYSIIVPELWIKEYDRLEKIHGKIPEDSLIWPEGQKYHIPMETAQHYIDLKRHEH